MKITHLCFLCSVVLLFACSTPYQQSAFDDELKQLSSVTVTSPGFSLDKNASFQWRRDVIVIEGDNIPDSVRNVNTRRIRYDIEKQLRSKGYRVTNNGSGQYELIAAVILGESTEGRQLEEIARFYPSLGDSLADLKKGTLMLGIARPSSTRLLWRSGIEAFIAENPTVEEQKQRLEMIVSSLLSGLPQ